MLDPRREAILVRHKGKSEFVDKTDSILQYKPNSAHISITYNGGKTYTHPATSVKVLRNPVRIPLIDGAVVEVDGRVREDVVELWRFTDAGTPWWRVFRATKAGERHSMTRHVRLLKDAARTTAGIDVLNYWRTIVSRIPDKENSLRQPYETLRFVHPESVLGKFINGDSIESVGGVTPLIFPFSSNISQREAVTNALNHSISVIDGPPGTGKTQSILNLIANIILEQGKTVGVVSFSNAAVDNVYEKLTDLGFEHVMAKLGRKEKREAFFEEELLSARASFIGGLAKEGITAPPASELTDLAQTLHRLQEDQRHLKRLKEELEAYRLERRHFDQYFSRQELPELNRLPLLKRSATTVLDFLAETELQQNSRSKNGLVRRIKRYLKYGPTRVVNPEDSDVVLQLQRVYYDKKVREFEQQVERLDAALKRADLDGLVDKHRELSVQTLRAALRERYGGPAAEQVYDVRTYKHRFAQFANDYPVILSTCHSLRSSLPPGYLLDYLVIDEASQVDLLAAGLALASCRKVVIVGDLRQLPHITVKVDNAPAPPNPAYDYYEHSILSSVMRLYGAQLPRTLLREHYRSDPAIIGFCNKKFYGGELIPYIEAATDAPALTLVRTTKGNHMRQHRGGGRSNRREIDVIREEVIPTYCPDTCHDKIAVTTPYRRQADMVAEALIKSIESDTVHKYQGRECDTVILTTVLDETWRGHTGTAFVDDPHLVNVAVSRAIRRFILVTNHGMLPKSRNLRDLIDYIRYANPDQDVVDSSIISVFDLLYREYSARLEPLAERLKTDLAYRSENIISTVLDDIRAEAPYTDLNVVPQMLLRNLLPDLRRLTPEQAAYVKHRSSVDFVISNRITNRLVLTIEVDGFKYHEDNPEQLRRDALKDQIFATYGIPLLRLPTTGSGEEEKIRRKLDEVLSAPV